MKPYPDILGFLYVYLSLLQKLVDFSNERPVICTLTDYLVRSKTGKSRFKSR